MFVLALSGDLSSIKYVTLRGSGVLENHVKFLR